MKPSESFLLLTTFAANNISTADENSAKANSFKTKQLLSGSNFLRLLFGSKNILLIILIYFILFTNPSNAKSCLSFLPYGFNESYVHLPQSASFCVKHGKIKNKYQTDKYGGRLLYDEALNNKIQVFGDSQVLGLDVENIEQHYLNTLYKKNNLIIYAAPNNGPYEVLNFLNKNKKILQKKIIVTFNFSTDVFRILDYFHPKNFVALKDYELDEILEHPFKYRLIVFKNLLLNKNFTLSRYDNKKMQNLFLSSDQDEFYNNLIKYFDELNETANKLDVKIDFIVTHPYWVYSIDKKNNKLLLDKELNEKVEKLICNSFQGTEKISKVLISQIPETLQLNDLTIDKRHLKSTKIKLKKHQEICGF
tara:strand:+ start:38 stop:1129 length:1092 start_codon:yes stop_codon:yes gene_type:complete